jgi:sugar phosphate isomerase/epimerase
MDAYRNLSEYAFSTWTLDTRPLKDALEVIARNGFTCVELWGDSVHLDPRAGQDLRLVRKWLADLNLAVHSVHGPFRNYENPPEDEAEFRALRMAVCKRALESASEVGAPIMVVHAVDRWEYNYRRDQTQIVGDFLADLCAYARPLGVQVALENIFPSLKTDDEIACTLQNQIKLFPGIGLKYCLDIGHAPLSKADPHQEALAAGGDLVTLHIHNNHGDFDDHNLPDDGIIDWNELYGFLRRMGYEGQFVFEILGGDDPEDVVRRTRALFDKDICAT